MNNKEVQDIYNLHHDWMLKCAYNFVKSKQIAEDIIQNVYIYLLEMENIDKIRYNKVWNMMYLYSMIKSRCLDKKNKHISNNIEIEIDSQYLEYDYEADQEFERKLNIVYHELSNNSELFWFDKKLFSIYIDENHSLTSLSQATKISRSSCWSSISKTKKHIKNKAL
jgi:DNA-directed RNA polymerase specialized sigma24 family protein